MSHEMRTPLNAIIGMATIAEKSPNQEKMNFCLSKINEASIHLLGVINDVLDISKIEAGKLDLSFVTFNFERMIKRVTDMIEFKINEKQQILNITIDPLIPAHVFSDEQRLAQALTNLLSNAVKFTPVQGIIALSVKVIETKDNLYTIRINVIDSGIGISNDQIEHLFKPFEQADSSISRRFGGTGLGLSITKNIIELMNGKILINSEPNKGTDIGIEITLEKSNLNQDKITNTQNWEKIKILVADSSWEVQELFTGFSKEKNLQCITTAGISDALSILESSGENQFDMVFIDLFMPGMEGINLCKKIKSLFGDKITVILMHIIDWDPIKEDAHKAEADGYIPKPIFPPIINETITNCISKKDINGISEVIDTIKDIFSGHTILVVDDIEINREIVLFLLEETNITVECAENGKIAVDKYTQNPERYSLILMDINMPEMGGYEATAIIRAFEAEQREKNKQLSERQLNIPIIAMTAIVFQEDVDKCLAAGMNEHLSKPLEIEKLIHTLKYFLPKK